GEGSEEGSRACEVGQAGGEVPSSVFGATHGRQEGSSASAREEGQGSLRPRPVRRASRGAATLLRLLALRPAGDELADAFEVVGVRCGGERPQQSSTVALGPDAFVQDGHHAAILTPPDQATEALLQ